MMRSLYSGVAGLKTHQTKMDVIGNNIANVNTTAYKSQSITFGDLLYQTTQSASGANATTGTGGTNARQIGLGSKTGAISTAITTQGSAQTTNNPFDIMITGDSFFVVSNGNDKFFTRDGSFAVDGEGNLVMSSTGYTVQGWQADENGNIIVDTVSSLRLMTASNMTYPPEGTSKGIVAGILDKNDTNVNNSTGKVMSLNFYDNLGYSYNAKFSIHAIDGSAGQYYVKLDNVLDSNGNPVENAGAKFGQTIEYMAKASIPRGTFVDENSKYAVKAYSDAETNTTKYGIFDVSNGLDDYQISRVWDANTNKYVFQAEDNKGNQYSETIADLSDSGATGALSVDDLKKYYGVTAKADEYPDIDDATVKFDATTGALKFEYKATADNAMFLNYDPDNGKFSGIGTSTTGLSASNKLGNITFGAANFKSIEVDFSNSSMLNNNGSSTISAEKGSEKGEGTGRKIGEMSGISISKDGIISASYDNGQTKVLGQIAVATFSNAAGLEKAGDNLYAATLNSGEFDGIGVDITTGGGYMTTGVLEMSNVDLAGEFTEMITTQRGFQANSRIITTSDSMLEELVNLKR